MSRNSRIEMSEILRSSRLFILGLLISSKLKFFGWLYNKYIFKRVFYLRSSFKISTQSVYPILLASMGFRYGPYHMVWFIVWLPNLVWDVVSVQFNCLRCGRYFGFQYWDQDHYTFFYVASSCIFNYSVVLSIFFWKSSWNTFLCTSGWYQR